MRLSDVRGDRTLDVIADLVGPVASIAEDEAAAALFRRERVPEGMTASQFFAKRVRTSLPTLLRGHKGDVISILSTVKGVTPEEYADGLSLASLLADVADLLSDEEFLGFLTSAGGEAAGGASGSASGTTEGPGEPSAS